MNPFIDDVDFKLYVGDVREVLATLPAGSVDCCVTSPPYWGLRDYGTGSWAGGDPDCDHLSAKQKSRYDYDLSKAQTGTHSGAKTGTDQARWDAECKCGATRTDSQIGLEATPELFVAELVSVFRELRRVLADHGTCFLNLGDSFGDKQLVGIPWRVAFALQADGWYLRSDIIWAKPNPMPESVTDRPTKSHEYVFLLSKQPRYFFDADAVREPHVDYRESRANGKRDYGGKGYPTTGGKAAFLGNHESGRNIRSVWEIATHPYADAHFATFPEALPERCIKAGCPERVCLTCGKASERIVERGASMDVERGSERLVPSANGRSSRKVGGAYQEFLNKHPKETTGWSDCGHDNWRTGTVLDPFMGSGTTALVARKLGRSSIGIELNPEYAKLCARRLQQLSLLAI